MYLMPVGCILKNGLNGKLCYAYFTIMKQVAKIPPFYMHEVYPLDKFVGCENICAF